MANFYDVNAAIEKPNFLAAAQQGYQVGQRQRAESEARADQQRLRELAPQVIAGDPSAYDQAAVINPDAAQGYQSAGDAQTRRMKGAIAFIEQAQKSGNPQAVESAYQQVRPYLARFGQEPPATFAEAEPKFNEARARIAMLDSGQQANVQSTQILANGNIGLVTRDGRVVDTGQKASPTTQLINEPGQMPYLVTTGRGAVGQTTGIGPAGEGSQTSTTPPAGQRMGDQQIVDFANQMTRAGVPQEAVEAWMRNQQSQPMMVGGSAPMAASTGPVPQRNPTAAEVEAAKTAARENVELSNLPRRGQIEAENAGAMQKAKTAAELSFANQQAAAAGATEEAKQNAQTRAELTQLLPKVQSESQRTVALIDRALRHPGREVATGASSRLDPRNFLPGTEATNFRVLLDQLRGGTFLQAFQSLRGGGAITETEGRKAEQAIARLDTAQSDEEFIKALEDLRQVAIELPSSIQAKLVATKPTQAAPRGPSPGDVEDGYRFRGGDPSRPENWEQVR